MNKSYEISKLEMIILLISMTIGVRILTLPRSLAIAVGTPDGWITIIIGAVCNMFIIFIIIKLQKNFPGRTLLNYISDRPIGKVLSKILIIIFAIYFIALLAYEGRILTVVIRMYLLNTTPSEVTLMLILAATTYSVTKGVQGIVHLNVMFIPIIMSIICLLVLFNIRAADFGVLVPIAREGWKPIFMGVSETFFAYLGIEILFFFLAYMRREDLKAATINVGVAAVMFTYIAVVVLCYAVISIEATEIITFPIVALAKEVEVIRGVIERFEPLLISIWIMTIFNTMSICHFLLAKMIKDGMFKKRRLSTVAIWIAFFAFIVTFIPKSVQETLVLGKYVAYLGYGQIFLLLLIGNAFVLFNKRRRKQQGSKGVL